MQRGLLREAVQRLRGDLHNIGFVHIEQAVWMLRAGNAGARMTLPAGLEAVLGYTRFAVGEAGVELPVEGAPQLLVERVSMHDERALAAALPGWQVETRLLSPAELPAGWQDNTDPWQALLDADAVGDRPGAACPARGRPFPAAGHGRRSKLLAEFFTNVRTASPGTRPLAAAGQCRR